TARLQRRLFQPGEAVPLRVRARGRESRTGRRGRATASHAWNGPVPAQGLQCAHGPEDQRALRQLRRLRAGLPEQRDHPGRDRLRDPPGPVHRMRRPLRRTAVRDGVPGRVHRPRSRTSRKRAAAAGQAAAPAGRATPGHYAGGESLNTMLRTILLLAFLAGAPALARETRPAHPPGAAIASAHALATDAGFETLRAGGNAFDAAIAVSAVLSVVEPISSGLGGGGFFLLHDAKSGRDVFVDARETAPASATQARYLKPDGEFDRDRAVNGPWSAGIPGPPAAFVHLAEKYGQLPLATSLAPAIRVARDGFPVYARFARGYQQRRDVMERYPGTREVFLAGGAAPAEGDVFRQPDLARTLQLLATQGFDGFYRGEVGDKLVAGVNAEGGQWSADELATYAVKEREPIRFRYRDWDITTAPPPSSGGIALAQMLQILEAWDLQQLDEAARTHLVVESMRRAFRDRTFYLGDPDFVQVPQRLLT